MVLTGGCWGRQYRDSYRTSSSSLLIRAYMTESKSRPHTPEVGAKNTASFKKDHLLIKLNCTHWRRWGNRLNEKEGSKKKKCKNKKTDKSLLSLCDLGRQKNKLHFCVMAPKGQNRHRVPLSSVCVRVCWYRFHQFPQERWRGTQAYLSAFHLGFFCILLHLCLLSVYSIGWNWLLLFQTALSLLMPQVLGLCTPWEPGLDRPATNLPR